MAKAYDLDLTAAKAAIRNLIAPSQGGPGKPGSLPYWGTGRIDLGGLNRMLQAQRQVGALAGAVDWNKIIDRRFLPPDQQKDY